MRLWFGSPGRDVEVVKTLLEPGSPEGCEMGLDLRNWDRDMNLGRR